MRRAPTVALALATVVALGGGLASCGSSSSTSASPSTSTTSTSAATAEDIAALAAVTVTGDLGKKPTIKLPATPFNVAAFVVRLVQDGTGNAITAGEGVMLHEEVVNGADGSSGGSTWSTSPAAGPIIGSNTQLGDFDKILETAHVGARLLIAYPSTSSATTATSSASAASTTDVIALDVMGTFPGRATGTAVPAVAGLPTVTLASNGQPTLTASTAAKPTTLVAQPLIKGAGATVTAGQTVTVHYSGWLWDGTAFDSSWSRGAPYAVADIGKASVIDGWNEGLVGQTVGSQVLLVVPPDKGYGATAQGTTIPANSTLVFVVDILAAS